MEAISGGDLLKHIKVLASDEYEGRAPGTKGEELTVTYLTDQFARLGFVLATQTGPLYRMFRWSG